MHGILSRLVTEKLLSTVRGLIIRMLDSLKVVSIPITSVIFVGIATKQLNILQLFFCVEKSYRRILAIAAPRTGMGESLCVIINLFSSL